VDRNTTAPAATPLKTDVQSPYHNLSRCQPVQAYHRAHPPSGRTRWAVQHARSYPRTSEDQVPDQGTVYYNFYMQKLINSMRRIPGCTRVLIQSSILLHLQILLRSEVLFKCLYTNLDCSGALASIPSTWAMAHTNRDRARYNYTENTT
jgi:hypothetical protein